MKKFRKALILLLMMAVTLFSVEGFGEEAKSDAEDAFETLRTLMEEPLSESIPVQKGHSLYAEVMSVEAAKAISDNTAPTPVDIVCQIQIDFEQNEYKIINSAINDVSGSEMADESGDEEANAGSSDETFVKYEAVTYSNLTQEQMLYYAYLIGSNYSTIQSKLPFGLTFLIVVKYGDNDLIMINDEIKAMEFTKTVKDIVANLASGE